MHYVRSPPKNVELASTRLRWSGRSGCETMRAKACRLLGTATWQAKKSSANGQQNRPEIR